MLYRRFFAGKNRDADHCFLCLCEINDEWIADPRAFWSKILDHNQFQILASTHVWNVNAACQELASDNPEVLLETECYCFVRTG